MVGLILKNRLRNFPKKPKILFCMAQGKTPFPLSTSMKKVARWFVSTRLRGSWLILNVVIGKLILQQFVKNWHVTKISAPVPIARERAYVRKLASLRLATINKPVLSMKLVPCHYVRRKTILLTLTSKALSVKSPTKLLKKLALDCVF